jgi:hypothetical protein
MPLDQPNPEAITKLQEFAIQLPRAAAPRRLQLNLASGDEFKKLVKFYLTKGLTKGIPSLFADVKALYMDNEKRQAIEEITESLREEYAASSLSHADPDVEPTTYLWTLYFLAQHYSYLSQHTKSLSLLDIAMKHTPTLPELHMFKARVLKRNGDYYGAARCLNDARLLDGQDRFLNTKCGKYMLRAGMVDEANTIFGMFTKVCSYTRRTQPPALIPCFRKMPQVQHRTSKTCNPFSSSSRKPTRIDEMANSILPSRNIWQSKRCSTTMKTINLTSMDTICANSRLTSTSSACFSCPNSPHD